MIIASTAAGATAAFGSAQFARARVKRAPDLANCDQPPSRPLAQQTFDLDQVAEEWGVFCEPSPIAGCQS